MGGWGLVQVKLRLASLAGAGAWLSLAIGNIVKTMDIGKIGMKNRELY